MNGISQGQTAPEYGRRKIRARILMSILGVSISGVAVGFFSYSELGLDPFQCFAHGVWNRAPLSFGTWYMLLNAALLALVVALREKSKNFAHKIPKSSFKYKEGVLKILLMDL